MSLLFNDDIIRKTNLQTWRMFEQKPMSFVHSVKKKQTYIPIFKNAHTYVESVFIKLCNWKTYDVLDDINSHTKIIILRDPLDRWISGISEYIHLHHKNWNIDNRDLLDLLYDVIIIDEHTKPQVNFLDGINIENCVFFKMDNNFTFNLHDWIQKNVSPFIKFNHALYSQSHNRSDTKPLQNTIKQKLYGLELCFRQRVEQCYKDDYDLFYSVKFYNARG